MPRRIRLLSLLLCAVAAALPTAAARATTTQPSLLEDDAQLQQNTAGTLSAMRALGVTIVKVAVRWDQVAPASHSFRRPRRFAASNPGAYPAASWRFLDGVVEQAHADGLQVGFMLTGPAPLWATGRGMPHTSNCPCGQWKPSARAFGQFAVAVGRRYSGTYRPAGAASPLPRVSWWSLWNEPNYGPDLAPQATDHDRVELSPAAYRGLLDAAWHGLNATGHTTRRDTILFGETAPRGLDHPIGDFSGIKPLRFLRVLYCLDNRYRRLRGRAASVRGCPAGAGGSRAFRARNPALFDASGYADHPYAQGTPPNLPTYACGKTFCVNRRTHRSDPDYADFAVIPRLERTLDRMVSAYGSHRRFPVWNTEYGYWTKPPNHMRGALAPQTAAFYMNWAEYLSYESSRISSYAQYLLVDPPNGNFAQGLELSSGRRLATYGAFQMPLFLPVTSTHKGSLLTVWGAIRPAPYQLAPAVAQVQFRPSGSSRWVTVDPVPVTNMRGYFTARVAFPGSGSVRIAWTASDGSTLVSRTQSIRMR